MTAIRTLLPVAGAILVALTVAHPPRATAEPAEPILTTSEAILAQAVTCDSAVSLTTGRQAVLLVHGTWSNSRETWSSEYRHELSAAGFGVCTVDLPQRATVDETRSAEYVVYAARIAYERTHRKIAIIGHSQGGTLAVWATKFWPDVARHTDDVIALSGNFGGSALAGSACLLGCTPMSWQLRPGSHLLHAVRTAPLAEGVSYTSIATQFDEVVFPQPVGGMLPGAANIQIQDICPGRPVDHLTIVNDAVGRAITLDALTHPGPAVEGDIDRNICAQQLLLPSQDLLDTTAVATVVTNTLNDGAFVAAEPALPPYALPFG
ncbi:alpha/beta fold hydrolase [Nocardia xishanensis]|uniref:esterase/lipase family protein n=1 Tax=Nocardia xishanensis TaxID=238964 RepID=UPI0033E84A0F